MNSTAIELKQVSRWFRMDINRTTTLKEYVVNKVRSRQKYNFFWALKDISLSIDQGEVLGIIGHNGAGKSTLLKVISGILKPSSGSCSLYSRVVPMLELGSGFDPELSGRENVYLNGAILGYSQAFLESKYDEIVAFSELQDFIEMPIKTYSSGMLARLAFSVATVVQPEILIVDEILSVGDENFQRKSRARMMELMSGGATVLYVSHDLNQIRNMCNRVLWLEHGETQMLGAVKDVCDAYAAR